LVTGIANPKPLQKYLEEQIDTYQMMHFNDHHIFSTDDWREIRKRFENIPKTKKMILTTEKDAMRLEKYAHEIDGMPFYVLPIEHKFLFNEGEKFMKRIIEFIENFKKPV
jgi:tetraacyldisaccharide 4'-kinase